MKLTRPALCIAAFGLALTLGRVGNAEPKGDSPSADVAKKPGKDERGASDPHKGHRGPRDEGGPPGRGGKDTKDEGRHGRGPEGAPGHDRDGPPGKGPSVPGRGPTDEGPPGLMKHHKARKERLAELEEKEKGGTLTEDEKAELEKARKIDARFDELRKRHDERGKDRAERRRSSKRKAMKHFPGFGKHPTARNEFRKHARRIAHLERAREVAVASGKDEQVARIDRLIAKENARHEKWLEHHQAKPETKGANP